MTITEDSIWGYVTARAGELGVGFAVLRGPRKDRELVAARALIATELRQAPWELSLPRIARALGRRDHSSIWWLLRGGRKK